MKKLYIIAASLLTLLAVSSCHEPEYKLPSADGPATVRNGINSLTASFLYDIFATPDENGNLPKDTRDENSFKSEINYEEGIITIVVPYTYPALSKTHLEPSNLTKMKMVANLDDNVTVTPELLFMDLSKDNVIYVNSQDGSQKKFIVRSEIRKSSECSITNYKLETTEHVAVVNEGARTISFLTFEPLGEQFAEVASSFGSKLSPDPNKQMLSYDEDFEITVTAQNGVDKKKYLVTRGEPVKVDFGMRMGSENILWAKKLPDDLGITTLNMTSTIAALKDYLVVNTRGEDLLVINRLNGQKAGNIVLDEKGSTKNFAITNDDNDNILLSNLTPNDGNVLKLKRIKGVGGTPEPYIEWDAEGAAFGRKISISGSLDGDAIITAPMYGSAPQFARWTVRGGVLTSQTPEIIKIADPRVGTYAINADVHYTDPKNTESSYFLAAYCAFSDLAAPDNRALIWLNGEDNTARDHTTGTSSNWIINAVDYTLFNGCPYVVYNTVNSFTWGSDDKIYMYDISTEDFSTKIWGCDHGLYGSMPVSGVANANGLADVALKVSDNGYYMYLYFMFSNGYVVCVQFDCIDM